MKLELIINTVELDPREAVELDERINACPTDAKLIIDMSKVIHISIAGIGVIASAIRTFRKVIVKGCNDAILHKFDILGIDNLITIK